MLKLEVDCYYEFDVSYMPKTSDLVTRADSIIALAVGSEVESSDFCFLDGMRSIQFRFKTQAEAIAAVKAVDILHSKEGADPLIKFEMWGFTHTHWCDAWINPDAEMAHQTLEMLIHPTTECPA